MNNLIRNIHLRNFRSLENTSVTKCGPLNVLIGKNNAGKSSTLAAIPMLFEHLATGRIVSSWQTERYAEQFTNRETDRPLQIGIELTLSNSLKNSLCESLRTAAPHLGKSIEQLHQETSVSFIFRFEYKGKTAYQYIESVSVGPIDASKPLLSAVSTTLLKTPEASSEALFQNFQNTKILSGKITAIRRLSESDFLSAYFNDKRSFPARYVIDRALTEEPNAAVRKDLNYLLEASDSVEALRVKASAEMAAAADEIDRISKIEIDPPLTSYTGEVKVQPLYIAELCREFGDTSILKLGERKTPIGKKEAARLLQLKVKRGGPERLQIVQQTVRTLLGVSLDAFQGENSRESAEMDVDNFLAEANGAGIRESLRLILDLELEQCDVILLEEPEVHLHPGLEFAVHSYLQEKSKTKQFFVTTHSTNFVDAVSPQGIYLISRDKNGISSCERLAEEDAPIKLPAELGIRLSTVFMFDRIVFVEGPSDESVLRELARTENIDLTGTGTAFVHMGGVSNFTHFAAQATLDLLSRRRVRMWFIVDRDELDEAEVRKMVDRLGDRARMIVLKKRELENLLVDENAVRRFVHQKCGSEVSGATYQAALQKVVAQIAEEAVDLYVHKRQLSPVYLRGKDAQGDPKERISSAISELTDRLNRHDAEAESIRTQILNDWGIDKAIEIFPGGVLLNKLCGELGVSFDKRNGDSVKLARCFSNGSAPKQIREILTAISSPN